MAMEIGLEWEYNGGTCVFVPNIACSPSRRGGKPNIRGFLSIDTPGLELGRTRCFISTSSLISLKTCKCFVHEEIEL